MWDLDIKKKVAMKFQHLLRILMITVCSLCMLCAQGQVINKVAVKGNKRVPERFVVQYSGLKRGDKADSKSVKKAITALYATKHFSNIEIDYNKSSGIVHIRVDEHPLIKKIDVTGGGLIPKESLDDILKKANVAIGKVYNPAVLNEIKMGIKQQYLLKGYQDVSIKEHLTKEAGNQVAIKLEIVKSRQYQVDAVTLSGNKAFSKKKLLEVMDLNRPSLFARLFGGNYYSQEAMEVCIARLREWYEDHGYYEIQIIKLDVEPLSNQQRVHIKLGVSEGPQYHLAKVEVTGDEKIRKLSYPAINQVQKRLEKGAVIGFSRKQVQLWVRHVQDVLERQGYGVKSIIPDLKVDEKTHKVSVVFGINQGVPTLVRHIRFKGNTLTQDKVLRREMLLSEGSVLTRYELDQSKRRMANLSYLKNVDYEIVPIDGQMVDVIMSMEEAPAAKISAELSKSNKENLAGGISIDHSNVFGTGNALQLKLEKVYAGRVTALIGGYVPYVFKNGVGMGYKFSYERKQASSSSTAGKTIENIDVGRIYSANVFFNFPLTLYADMDLSFKAKNHHFSILEDATPVMKHFIGWGGKNQKEYIVEAILRHRTLNRYNNPTSGHYYELNNSLGSFGRINYWTVNARASWYIDTGFLGTVINPQLNIAKGFGYSKGYKAYYLAQEGNLNGFSELPPSRKFYGGVTSPVRGVLNFGDKLAITTTDSNGDTQTRYDAQGGELLTTASLNLVLPNMISDSVTTSVFLDGGYAYNRMSKDRDLWFDMNKWVYSTGVQMQIQTPIAPIVLMWSRPIKIERSAVGRDLFKSGQFSIQAALL